jgi:large subunit ribosomal protein L10
MNETTIAKKSEQVELVTNKFKGANSIVFVDYLGLTVEEITQLRVAITRNNANSRLSRTTFCFALPKTWDLAIWLILS